MNDFDPAVQNSELSKPESSHLLMEGYEGDMSSRVLSGAYLKTDNQIARELNSPKFHGGLTEHFQSIYAPEESGYQEILAQAVQKKVCPVPYLELHQGGKPRILCDRCLEEDSFEEDSLEKLCAYRDAYLDP
ncbi:MAG: hypothetical protein KJ559_01540 [Nanoarchaeota archaeon]|nr:hypothetical protein [Nanoarchaeota archaeon]